MHAAAGSFVCELGADGLGMTWITAVPPEAAVVAVRGDGPRSPLYFTVGSTLYEVHSNGEQAVAEAIIAQTR